MLENSQSSRASSPKPCWHAQACTHTYALTLTHGLPPESSWSHPGTALEARQVPGTRGEKQHQELTPNVSILGVQAEMHLPSGSGGGLPGLLLTDSSGVSNGRRGTGVSRGPCQGGGLRLALSPSLPSVTVQLPMETEVEGGS